MPGKRGSHERPSDAYTRFIASMEMDMDKWRDGTGYDLGALDELTADEREAVRGMLKGRSDWRDVEAMAHLSPPSVADLRVKFGDEGAPLVARLRAGEELERLGETVDFVPLVLVMLDAAASDVTVMSRVFDFIEWRQPKNDERVRRKILTLLMSTRDRSATNLAAIACVVYGLTPSMNDWTMRPFWLRFQEPQEHDAAFAELLAKIGVTREDLLR